jgi:histidinol-phosphate/aromatic aminotransferase/cobyric acid decarboxylase-like protein
MIIIRSLTKDHGLAGLRLGYAIARPEYIEILRAVQPPWSVNSLAQVAGVAALQPDVSTWRRQSLAQLHHHAADLWNSLSQMGFRVLPTSTTYALVEVDHAAILRRSLLAHGLLVRDCTSFGLPAYIRIAARLPEENERLLAALQMTTDDGRRTTDD